MTNVTHKTQSAEQKPLVFGARLQSAREAMGMDRKDAAAHLRLHEKIVIMMESGVMNNDLPLTFIRGYIRSYSKLLNIPEQEVKEALNLIEPQPVIEEIEPAPTKVSTSTPSDEPVTSSNVFMQLLTVIIVVTLIGLVAVWWKSHKNVDSQFPPMSVENLNQTMNKAAAPYQSPRTSTTRPNAEAVAAAPATPIENRADAALAINMNTTPSIQPAVINPTPTTSATPAPSPSAQTAHLPPSTFIHPLTTKTVELKNTYLHYLEVGEKQATHWFLYNDYYLQSLFDFILFLLLMKLGLRKYYRSSPTLMTNNRASARTAPRPFRPLRKRLNRSSTSFPIKKVISVLAIIGIVFYLGFRIVSWYKETPVPIAANVVKQQPVVVDAKKTPQEINIPIEGDLETLAPSSHLHAKLLGAFKTNTLLSANGGSNLMVVI